MAMVDFESRPPKISYAVNGDWLGVAHPLHGYKVGNADRALFPHVLSKNCRSLQLLPYLFVFFNRWTRTNFFRLRNDLYCVGWGVNLCSLTHADQLRRQSLQRSLTSSLELSADGPRTAGLVIQRFQTVAENDFIWSVGSNEHSVNPPLTALEIQLQLRFFS